MTRPLGPTLGIEMLHREEDFEARSGDELALRDHRSEDAALIVRDHGG